MKWIILAVLNWAATLLCWLTNPIVVLFCDEEGELPSFLKYWQTWDDSCYAEQEVMEEAPSLLRYDWHSKYFKCVGEIEGTGRTRVYTRLYPSATFTIKERIQRYCCAVMWLTRNPAYGFSFYVFGRDIDCDTVRWVILDGYHIGYDRDDKSWNAAWCIKDDRYICKYIRKSWYLGWKIPTTGQGVVRCMIASRLSLRFKK